MTINAHKLTTTIAVRYFDAARVLHKNSPSPNALWEPLNHLFAMSAELALKAFLESVGVSDQELRKQSIRHSLNSLLLLAVRHGLRTSHDVADVLLEIDEAHASHAYRYIPRPANGDVTTVYSAHPTVALAAIQRLLEQCATDPSEVKTQTKFPEDWLPASLPLHPVSTEQLEDWISEKQSLRASFSKPKCSN
ncbi:MAG: hypothetical protein KDK08_06455 [Rhizobiaceae bacterium]|jgi:hypothetical protein|nr:hypothetical protein [Rhizobiaceae bacterium]